MERNSQFLRFDGIEIDLAGRRLRRDGADQPLEPKAFAVLVLMAQQPGRAFERDEILDAVWGHTHITPGTLNRIITLLRHALGEDAQQPRYLHTVHGVGYRFDAQVVSAAGTAETTTMTVRQSSPTLDANVAESSGSPASMVAVEPATAPSPPGLAAEAAQRQPRTSRRSSVRIELLVLLLTLVLAGLWWAQRFASPPDPARAPAMPSPQADARVAPVLTVLPLRPLGDDARGAEFADGLSEELINLLARIEGLRVTSRTSSFKFRHVETPLAEIAQQLGATHLLEGSVRQDGERLRIALRLIDAHADQTLWTETYDREFRDIFAVQDSIARAVSDTLQLRLGLPEVSARRDEDPALYRRYLLARRNYETTPYGPTPGMVAEQLRALTREHPDYARAWGGLSAMLWVQSGQGSSTLVVEAESAAAMALQLDPDQPDAHAVLAGQACREQRWADCLKESRRAVENAPSDSFWRSWHVHRLMTMGYAEAALREARIAMQLDPLASLVHLSLGRVLDTLGRHDEALVHLRFVGLPAGQTASFLNAIWRQDLVEARRLARTLDPSTPWRNSQLAVVDAIEDPARLSQALSAIEESESKITSHAPGGPFDFNRLVLPVRDYAVDIEGLSRLQRSNVISYHWIFWMPGESELRRSPVFQDYLRRSGLLDFWKQNGWPDRCRSDGGDGVACD